MTKEQFWKKYIEAGELDRGKILDELAFYPDRDGLYNKVSKTLIQSYFDDIIEYMQNLKPSDNNKIIQSANPEWTKGYYAGWEAGRAELIEDRKAD